MSDDNEALLGAGSPPSDSGTDATPDSSPGSQTPTDATPDSSTEGGKAPASLPESLEDARKLLTGEGEADVNAGAGDGIEDSPSTDAESGPGQTNGADAPKDGQAAAGKPDDADVPFHSRPEWQAAVKIGGDKIKPVLRALLGNEHKLKQQVSELGKSRDVVDRIRASTGDEAGFQNAVGLIETYAHDPANAVPMLEQLLSDARQRAGLVVTSPDLKERLDNGRLDEDAAIELERSRAEQKRREAVIQQREQAALGKQTEALIAARTQALNVWEKETAGKDPDYANLQELVIAQAARLEAEERGQKGRMLSAEEMVGVAERAYQTVRGKLVKASFKPRANNPVLSGGSSNTAKAQPKDYDDFRKRTAEFFQ